jgi:hypothetical protein
MARVQLVLRPPAPPPPAPQPAPPPPPPPATTNTLAVEAQFFLLKVPDEVNEVVVVDGVLITFVGPIIPPLPAII